MEKITDKLAWDGYVKPFRIFGNLYFVGTVPASTHLIDTGDGLIVIDPGYPVYFDIICENIVELGFDVKDVKYIVLTHGHYDHYGAVNLMLEKCDAKTYIGKEDLSYVDGSLDGKLAEVLTFGPNEVFTPDVLLSDGDKITLGNTEIVCRSAPGHTPGTMAFFFDVTDGEKTYRAAMHGGVGRNTMRKSFLEKSGLGTETREKFIPAIECFIDEPVDITLGNHVVQNDTVGKSKRMTETFNPFIDSTEWRRFLEDTKEKYYEMIDAGE